MRTGGAIAEGVSGGVGMRDFPHLFFAAAHGEGLSLEHPIDAVAAEGPNEALVTQAVAVHYATV